MAISRPVEDAKRVLTSLPAIGHDSPLPLELSGQGHNAPWRSLESRLAHNQEVAGSNPAGAIGCRRMEDLFVPQLSLFDNPHAGPLSRASDPVGSYVAAAHLKASGKYESDSQLVLAALRLQRQPVTSKILANLMRADRHLVAKRLPDLERAGRAERRGVCPITKETLWGAV